MAKTPTVLCSLYSLGATWQVHGMKKKAQAKDGEVLNAFQQVESVLLPCLNTARCGGGAGVHSHRCLGYNRISRIT